MVNFESVLFSPIQIKLQNIVFLNMNQFNAKNTFFEYLKNLV